MRRAFKYYQHCLKHYTLATQSVQTGLIMGTGDILTQYVIEKQPIRKISLKRTSEYFCLGSCVVGPALATWYKSLDKIVGGTPGVVHLIKKVLVDQFVFVPCIIGVLLVLVNTLRGVRLSQIWKRFKEDYSEILTSDYKLWPWIQLLNFQVVPLQYQTLFSQVIALFWHLYISVNRNVRKPFHSIDEGNRLVGGLARMAENSSQDCYAAASNIKDPKQRMNAIMACFRSEYQINKHHGHHYHHSRRESANERLELEKALTDLQRRMLKEVDELEVLIRNDKQFNEVRDRAILIMGDLKDQFKKELKTLDEAAKKDIAKLEADLKRMSEGNKEENEALMQQLDRVKIIILARKQQLLAIMQNDIHEFSNQLIKHIY